MNPSEHTDRLGFGEPDMAQFTPEQRARSAASWRAHMIAAGQGPDRCGIWSNTKYGKRCVKGYHHSGECEFER